MKAGHIASTQFLATVINVAGDWSVVVFETGRPV
jgi:hypothetical protein